MDLQRLAATALTTAVTGALVASAGLAIVPSSPAAAETSLGTITRMVSRDDAGDPVKGFTDHVAISGDGRFVAFTTGAAIVSTDTNGTQDIYVRDRWAATIELVSVTSAEGPIAGASDVASLSDDGRYVVFTTDAPGLIPGDNKGLDDAFVRDRYEGTTTRVAPGVGGALLDGAIAYPRLSGNGRFVVFGSTATNLVASDTNLSSDIFVRDLQAKTTERASVSSLEGQAAAGAYNGTISDDGRYVAFDSSSLLAGGVVGEQNTYVRDRTAGTTELVNVTSAETLPDAGGATPSISGDGRHVTFSSAATNLVAGDTNGTYDAFMRDLAAGTTVRVSLANDGSQLATGGSAAVDGIDDDGSHVLFHSTTPAATGTDAGADVDVYLRGGGATRRVTTGPNTVDPATNAFFASIDDTGANVAFRMTAKLTSDAAFDQSYVYGAPGIGPLPSSALAIDQLYQDFLGRAATTTEVTTWTNRLNRGSADLATLVAQLAATPAYSTTRAPLVRLYWAFFLRRPDSSGLTFWLNRYQKGASLTTIAQSFATSSEFTNRYGPVSNGAYVKLVYENVFERQPDASGLAFWTGKLDRKEITRGGVIVAFSESSEGKRRLAGPTNITLITLAMLGGVPSPAVWNALYPTIDAGERQAAWIGRKLLASSAYASRFA